MRRLIRPLLDEHMPQTAFIVVVPEAEEHVRALRERFDPSALLGVPAHITILYPFMSPDLIDARDLSDIQALLASEMPFAFSLDRIERFPAVTYLAPTPALQFERLTRVLVDRFPEYPPYGGRFSETVPHLTVAHGSEANALAALTELTHVLNVHGPIHSVCQSVLLIENSSGLWRQMHTFRLAGST